MNREKINQMKQALMHWDDLEADIGALSGDLEEGGWETLVLEPGDVTAVPLGIEGEPFGFHLVVPDDELRDLATFVERTEAEYDSFDAYRSETSDLLLFVVVLKAETEKRAILYPLYYDPERNNEFIKAIQNRDELYTHVSNIGESQRFRFRHTRTELFLPE